MVVMRTKVKQYNSAYEIVVCVCVLTVFRFVKQH